MLSKISKKEKRLLIISSSVIVVVALALGLGIGLGAKKYYHTYKLNAEGLDLYSEYPDVDSVSFSLPKDYNTTMITGIEGDTGTTSDNQFFGYTQAIEGAPTAIDEGINFKIGKNGEFQKISGFSKYNYEGLDVYFNTVGIPILITEKQTEDTVQYSYLYILNVEEFGKNRFTFALSQNKTPASDLSDMKELYYSSTVIKNNLKGNFGFQVYK